MVIISSPESQLKKIVSNIELLRTIVKPILKKLRYIAESCPFVASS
jgi:hypothetical protein